MPESKQTDEVTAVGTLKAAAALVGLGADHRSAGRLAEAHRAWVRALEITEEILGPDTLQLARIFCCLAELELARGRFVTGEPYARRSLEICTGAANAPEEQVADSIRLLADLLEAQGRSAEAELITGKRRHPTRSEAL
jgi:hypothetical protein